MAGAPDVLTNKWQQQSSSDPGTDATATVLRAKQVIQEVPVYGSSTQFSVPPMYWNMGWKSSDIPTVPGPTYPYPVQAPPVQYASKPYTGLIAKAASPDSNPNRPAYQLSAPSIETTY